MVGKHVLHGVRQVGGRLQAHDARTTLERMGEAKQLGQKLGVLLVREQAGFELTDELLGFDTEVAERIFFHDLPPPRARIALTTRATDSTLMAMPSSMSAPTVTPSLALASHTMRSSSARKYRSGFGTNRATSGSAFA